MGGRRGRGYLALKKDFCLAGFDEIMITMNWIMMNT